LAYNIQYDPKAIKQLQKLDKSIAKQLLDGIEEFIELMVFNTTCVDKMNYKTL
jgi:mRNA-degrading endonuclease RelE of RelBE toxin-antitoxin system